MFWVAAGVTTLIGHLLEHRVVQHRLGKKLRQLGVLILDRLKMLGIGYVHAAILEPRTYKNLAGLMLCLRLRSAVATPA